MIDLHLHTTASDGLCPPALLVRRLRRRGIRVFSVTDHDTTAALAETRELAARHGLAWWPGIEITTVWGGTDVHILGYGFDECSTGLARFLATQRAERVARVRKMGSRLAALGAGVDVEGILEAARQLTGRAVGRPALADALVAAGHVASRQEAFDRFLARGRPAYVPRLGPPPAAALDVIEQAGGIAVLAHPGLLADESLIGELAGTGRLVALEVYHPAHDRTTRSRYRELAQHLRLSVSGGSDYHGDTGGDRALGAAWLPAVHYDRLVIAARRRGCAVAPPRRSA